MGWGCSHPVATPHGMGLLPSGRDLHKMGLLRVCPVGTIFRGCLYAIFLLLRRYGDMMLTRLLLFVALTGMGRAAAQLPAAAVFDRPDTESPSPCVRTTPMQGTGGCGEVNCCLRFMPTRVGGGVRTVREYRPSTVVMGSRELLATTHYDRHGYMAYQRRGSEASCTL